MLNKNYRIIYSFFLFFALHFLCSADAFAANKHSKKHSWITYELRAVDHNSTGGILVNANNPIQLASYQVVKPVHFIKVLICGMNSSFFSSRGIKYNYKRINSECARFRKLILYPKHVFW